MMGRMYSRFGKRTFDLFLAILLIILLLPIGAVALLICSVISRGNPFYLQKRIGRREQPFLIYKFRTLDHKGEMLKPFGALIRKYSIDEIPQLLNVLRGDMSVVGPRPLYPEYLQYYSDLHKKRHEVRPGITGWAQVKGRNDLDWRKRLDLDVDYLNMMSFATDLKLLWRTLFIVLRAKGADGHRTLKPFRGYG